MKSEGIVGLRDKTASVKDLLAGCGSVLVALSGGVDSSVMLSLAADRLGASRVLAATVRSEVTFPRELELAVQVARMCGVAHRVIEVCDLSRPEFMANTPERCYHCKLNRFSLLKNLARDLGLGAVIDGSNASDRGDYRPGMRALAELGVRSPLLECGITKDEVRLLAGYYGLPNRDKPSDACLASRFPYGTPITREGLSMVAQGEAGLRSLGLSQCRLRHHGNTARIEAAPGEFSLLLEPKQRLALVKALKEMGYVYVTLDLEGFRSGSLNESL